MSEEFKLTNPDCWGDKDFGDATNANMNRAKSVKNDEFYTRMEDIEREIACYSGAFQDRVVYSNCDQDWSNFVKFFEREGVRLGIKEFLWHPGPFGGSESIELLKRADIVVTNPPFSHYRSFISQLTAREKDFLVIGSLLAIWLRCLYPLIQRGVVRVGYNSISSFETPERGSVGVGCQWYTTLPVKRAPLDISSEYSPHAYLRYDNYDAIEVGRVKDIPIDYDGVMGVPVTFMSKHNPDQFEIVDGHNPGSDFMYINGKKIMSRILIRHRRNHR